MTPRDATPPVTCIACSIFRQEIRRLQEAGSLAVPVKFLSSMLHITPDILDRTLKEVVARETAQGNRVVMAFGDCCAHMEGFEDPQKAIRTTGINCCEIVLGTEEYRRLRKDGAFFVMPEWAQRWQEVFHEALGLSPANAREFMKEMHTRLIYLDTGQMPIPQDKLAEMVEYTGLPLEIRAVSLEPLLANLQECLHRLELP
jgi:hypothetical protein